MPYLKSKLQRDINAQTDVPLIFHLSNIRINKKTVGCLGFIAHPTSDKIVYVNTEKSSHGSLAEQNLYRRAKHVADYTGERNFFASNDELPIAIINMLQ